MRLDIKVRHLPDGTGYILLEDVEESHRENVYLLAQMNECLFTVDDKDACHVGVIVEYSQGGIAA